MLPNTSAQTSHRGHTEGLQPLACWSFRVWIRRPALHHLLEYPRIVYPPIDHSSWGERQKGFSLCSCPCQQLRPRCGSSVYAMQSSNHNSITISTQQMRSNTECVSSKLKRERMDGRSTCYWVCTHSFGWGLPQNVLYRLRAAYIHSCGGTDSIRTQAVENIARHKNRYEGNQGTQIRAKMQVVFE